MGSWGGRHPRCKGLEVSWHSSIGRRRNGVCGRRGLYLFLQEARKRDQAPAESRSKENNSALRGTWRGKCPPGLDGCLRWPHLVREGPTSLCTNACVQHTLQHQPLQRSREEIISQHLFSPSASALSQMMCARLQNVLGLL